MPHLVAVLLPVRDGARTLPSCLDSLERQTFRDFRVVAVDDGSSDGTAEILLDRQRRWFAAHASSPGPFLSLVRLAVGRGIAGALAAAAIAAPEERYLARQDADDISLPGRLERQVRYLEDHPDVGVLATGIETLREEEGLGSMTDGWRRYEAWLSSSHTPEEIARSLWIESPLPHPTVMMRRESLLRAGGYVDVPWPEDYDLWLRMLRAHVVMAKLPEALYRWRDHSKRASRTLDAYAPARFLACRAHHFSAYVKETPELSGREIVVWGAGRDGRRTARALLAEGAPVTAFLDIDPRKIGRRAFGKPIHSAETWLSAASGAPRTSATGPPVSPASVPKPLVLAAVGTAGARELIRARLEAAGLREGTDYFCLA